MFDTVWYALTQPAANTVSTTYTSSTTKLTRTRIGWGFSGSTCFRCWGLPDAAGDVFQAILNVSHDLDNILAPG